MTRTMAITDVLLCDGGDRPWECITAVENVRESGDLRVKVLHVGRDILMLEVARKKGQVDPPHRHDDHESCGYLIEGRMHVQVGEESFVAGPGSSWRHPAGVIHASEALTDCRQIEIKSPPRKTWASERP
jgi:quercetin dioxygenase-like cupin family protein